MTRFLAIFLVSIACISGNVASAQPADETKANPLRIAAFQVDATPRLGSPLCDGAVPPAKEIVDPLSARGIVLFAGEKPIVLCAVDWVGIGNGGHDAFRVVLAEAVGTTVDRVSVHTVHQHDAPGCDFSAEAVLAESELAGNMFDVRFARDVIARLARAAKAACDKPSIVTHLGLGTAAVENVASNRRILGPDGKVRIVRFSSSRDADAIAAPEGVIDPLVRLVSFWNGDQPLVVVSHYATHPQSYYGQGGVSADFVGMARQMREEALPGVTHVHFNGAAGNVAAGKYNNGAPAVRPVLARRLAAGMTEAWSNTRRFPISAGDVRWRTTAVALPLRDMYREETHSLATINSTSVPMRYRIGAASDIAYIRLIKSGRKIDVNCLQLGSARILYMPGELFVEYQLAAQEMRPNDFVAMAAYGDYGPGYIGTEIAYSQGGYETGPPSRTAPEVEKVLLDAMRRLLAD